MVDSVAFERLKDEVSSAILTSIEVVLRRHGLTFNQDDMQRQGSVDLDQIALEALTLGADCWPQSTGFMLRVANSA